MSCPTSCDDDCHVPCHEGHEVRQKRQHAVETCPGELNKVVVLLRDRDDDLAAGPFESYEDAQRFESEDVYATEVDGAWFAQRRAAIEAGVFRG